MVTFPASSVIVTVNLLSPDVVVSRRPPFGVDPVQLATPTSAQVKLARTLCPTSYSAPWAGVVTAAVGPDTSIGTKARPSTPVAVA